MTDGGTSLGLDATACFVAITPNGWVGYTLLDTAHSERSLLRQSWTGVIPSHRRRGIGTALKVLAIRYAEKHGYEAIATTIRSTNLARRALNQRVGFRPTDP